MDKDEAERIINKLPEPLRGELLPWAEVFQPETDLSWAKAMNPETDYLFKVTEPSGKTYEIFTDGRITGFSDGSTVDNRFHALTVSQQVQEYIKKALPIFQKEGQ